jgi:hypothetical protein
MLPGYPGPVLSILPITLKCRKSNSIIAESEMRGPAIRTPASLSSSLRPAPPPGIPVPSDPMFAPTQSTHKRIWYLIYYDSIVWIRHIIQDYIICHLRLPERSIKLALRDRNTNNIDPWVNSITTWYLQEPLCDLLGSHLPSIPTEIPC